MEYTSILKRINDVIQTPVATVDVLIRLDIISAFVTLAGAARTAT